MIPSTLGLIAMLCGGRLVGGADPATLVTGPVVADSREVVPGCVFVATPGERVDGHDFAVAAVAAGAVAVLASRDMGVPAILVDPVAPEAQPGVPMMPATVLALGRWAAAQRDGLDTTDVIALTGSSGKTTTKDLLAQVLGIAGPVVAPRGSFNTEVGLPLTVLAATEETTALVLEMGARGRGHIAYLAGIARPEIGLVLNVGTAHIGEFGSREGIAVAKRELVEALPVGALAVLNADDPLVAAMAEHTAARVLTFGESADADVRAEEVRLDPRARAGFTLVFRSFGPGSPEQRAQVQLSVVGEHQVSNALAVAAVALATGLDIREIAPALSAATIRSPWRMEVLEAPGAITVINDSYNANPDSVRAALKALVALGGSGGGRGRTWAVLGEMLELGPDSVTEHDAIGRLVVRLDVSKLVVIGEGARTLHLGAAQEGSWGDESVWVPDIDAAITLLRDELLPGDVVLVKASRGIGLERVVDALMQPKWSQGGPDDGSAGGLAP